MQRVDSYHITYRAGISYMSGVRYCNWRSRWRMQPRERSASRDRRRPKPPTDWDLRAGAWSALQFRRERHCTSGHSPGSYAVAHELTDRSQLDCRQGPRVGRFCWNQNVVSFPDSGRCRPAS